MALCPFMSDSSKNVNCTVSCALYKSGKCAIKVIAESNETNANAQIATAEALRVLQMTGLTK